MLLGERADQRFGGFGRCALEHTSQSALSFREEDAADNRWRALDTDALRVCLQILLVPDGDLSCHRLLDTLRHDVARLIQTVVRRDDERIRGANRLDLRV